MSTNPYQSPSPPSELKSGTQLIRNRAEKQLRISIALLMASAVFNVAMFSSGAPVLFKLVNFCGIAIVGTVAWQFSMSLLECASRLLHRVFARRSECHEWIGELYETLMKTLPFAVLGTLLWAAWVILIYIAKMNFYQVSVPVGIAAHLLAAGIYLQLAFRWWRIERTDSILPGA